MTGPVLHALAPAHFTTIQDLGRVGWRRFGLTGSGAMDPEALALANALVGNPVEAACVEFAHAGGDWTLRGTERLAAVAGGGFAVTIDGRAAPRDASAILREGQVLRIGAARDAVWGYLAIAGGLLSAREFGSRATHVASGVGGVQGRRLRANDTIPLARDLPPRVERTALPLPRRADAPIRVVMGPQDDFFTTGSIATLLSTPYEVTWQGDRMGYRLQGERLSHVAGFNIVSDGLLPGSIQVPGAGQPIVLLMDAQTTGGYPKIATVITADLGRFAQRRPRGMVRFQAVSLEDAQILRREFVYRLQATRLHLIETECGDL